MKTLNSITTTFFAYTTIAINLFFRSCPPCPSCAIKYLTLLNLIGVPIAYQKTVYIYLKSPIFIVIFTVLYIFSLNSLLSKIKQMKHPSYTPIIINLTSFLSLSIVQMYNPDLSIKYAFLTLMMLSFLYAQHCIKKTCHKACCSDK